MTVSASHRLMVELSMQEGEFTQGIGFANAALDTFRNNLKKMAAEAKAASASVQASMTQVAANAKAQVGASTAAANAVKRTTQATSAANVATQSGFVKVLDLANKNKVAWNQTANRIAIAGAAMVGVFAAVAVGFASFERAMDQATAVIDVSILDMRRLSEAAVEAGRTTQFSATEAAQGIEALAKAGVSASAIYSGALLGAINLAAAGGLSLGEAAETAAIMMIQFNKEGKDVPHIADLLAAAAGKAVGDVHDLAMALKQGGLIASQFGLSIEDTTSTLALFAQNGLLGSDAGTSLKIMLLRLAAPATRAQKEMHKLGIDVWDANGAFIGMENFAGQLQERLGGLTDEEKDHALSVIFGTDAMRSASIMLKEGANGYKAMAQAVNDDGFAFEVMSKRMDNLAGDAKRLAGAWDSLVVSAGTGSNSALRSMTQGLTAFVNAIGRMDPSTLNGVVQAILGIGGGGLAVAALMKMTIGVNNFRKALSGGNGALSSFVSSTRNLSIAAGIASAALLAIGITSEMVYNNMKAVIGTTTELAGVLEGLAKSDSIDVLENRLKAVTHNAFKPDQDIKTQFKQYMNQLQGAGLGGFGRGLFDIGAMIGKAFGQPDAIREFFQATDEGLASLVAGGDLQSATGAFAKLFDELDLGTQSAEDIKKAFPLLFNAAVNFANGLDLKVVPSTQDYVDIMRGKMPPAVALAVAEQNKLNGTFDRTGIAALDAATKVRQAVTQMSQDLKDALEPLDARSSFEAAIDDSKAAALAALNEADAKGKLTAAAKKYREEVKKLGPNWMKNLQSGTGREIFGAAERIATTGMASLEKDMPNLNSGQVQTRIKKINDAIRDYAHTAGLGKAATQALIDEFGLVPSSIKTTFEMPGADVSKQQAKDLQIAVDQIPELASVEILAPGARPSKKEVDDFIGSLGSLPPEVESIIRTVAELGGVDAAKTAMAHIPDVEAWVKTMVDKYGVNWWANYKPSPKDAWINVGVHTPGKVKGGRIPKADGGPIPGWSPNKRADNIPIAATAGEFMQPVDSVRYYGETFMEKLRKRIIPRNMIQHLAEGGPVHDRSFVQAPIRVVSDRGMQVDNSRGDIQFAFPNARFGATPSEMMGAFGFAVNAGLASVGL